MNLVVGATGLVGTEICRGLVERGVPVRALVRHTSSADRVALLKSLGVPLVFGDLKDRASLDAACRGVATVVSTASSTLSRQPGDSIETVDHRGQLDLIAAAEAAGVTRFVLVSFAGLDLPFPLQTAKRAAEKRLIESRMSFAILQPSFFSEVWLGPALGFDVAAGTVRIYGAGVNPISWISFHDVAKFCALATGSARGVNTTIRIGGPDALSPLEVVRAAEQTTGRKFVVEHVPEQALRAEYDAATDPMQKSFAALMLYYAGGDVVDTSAAARTFPGQTLKSVRDHLNAWAAPV